MIGLAKVILKNVFEMLEKNPRQIFFPFFSKAAAAFFAAFVTWTEEDILYLIILNDLIF